MSSEKKFFGKLGVLVADRKGAALPEFALAIFPLITIFFVLMQVAEIFIGHLLLHHAAVVAARCEVVDKGPDLPGKYVDSDGDAACTNAAIAGIGVGSWYKGVQNIKAKADYAGGTAHDDSQYGDVTTTTEADFKCGVPIGKIICNGGSKKLSFTIKLPHEGALYKLDNDYNGS
jgi:hypothetical protein